MHPSELPSFASLVATRKQVRSRTARAIASVMLAALFIGGAGLASTQNSPPPNQAMPAQIVTSLDALPQVARAAAQRTVVEAALGEANVDRIPPRPDGKHVASDLLSFFFYGSDGQDFLYGAAIRRDRCRGLGNSGERPAPLR